MSVSNTRAVWLYSQTDNVAQRLLLLAIADGINTNEDNYYGKVSKLAYKMGGKTERYVQKLLNELVALGELIIEERPKSTSRYYIPMYPGEPGYNPQQCEGKKHRCNGWHTPLDKDRETWEIEHAEKAKKEYPRTPVHPSKGEPQFTEQGRTPVHPEVNPSSPIRANSSSPQGRTLVHPEPIRETRSVKREDKPGRALPTPGAASDISFSNQKQKTAEAERPRSMPTDGNTARLPDVTPLPDPTPPVAPPPLAPSEPAPKPAPNYGTETPLYWFQTLAAMDNQYTKVFIHQYLSPCKLYKRRPGFYVLVAPTPFVQEQINVRARDRIVMYLAAVAREHVELEVVTR